MDTYFIVQLVLAFLIGWFGSAVWNYVLNLGHSALMVKYIGYSMMCFSKLVSEHVVEFLQVKYKSLDEMGLDKNKIKIIVNEDRHMIEQLQKTVVGVVKDSYPQKYNHQINFNNWNQMMTYISENQRRYDA